MKENVFQRMEREGTKEFTKRFMEMQKWDYKTKLFHAASRANDFVNECKRRGLNYHASVGGLDSITMLLWLRRIGIEMPAISASTLEDKSIQAVHKQIGVVNIPPLKDKDGKTYTKARVIRDFGFPVISKEIAAKIELLQNPTQKNKTVRHAIITGETGEYGGNQKNSRMKLAQKWLDLFGGYENETEGCNYGCPDFKVSSKCCYYLKERPCDIWAKEHNSVPFVGLMASEGGRREKALKMHGCNYFGATAIRCAPFAIFSRQDVLQLALDLEVPVPEIYGEIVRDPDGTLRTTGAERTGCSLCGFGIHLEKRPNRFDKLRERAPKEWEYLMTHLVQDGNGEWYGWGRVLDYIGVGWQDEPGDVLPGQINFFEQRSGI